MMTTRLVLGDKHMEFNDLESATLALTVLRHWEVDTWSARIQTIRTLNNVELSQEVVDAVQVLCNNQAKITAIKMVRSLTGAGLKEAKDFVEFVVA